MRIVNLNKWQELLVTAQVTPLERFAIVVRPLQLLEWVVLQLEFVWTAHLP